MDDQQQLIPQYIQSDNESSLLKYQINVDETLEKIRLMLLNINYDPETEQFVQGAEKLYDKKHVDKMMHILKSFINKETILSGFTDKNIYDLVYEAGVAILDYMTFISVESKVKDRETINMLFWSIVNYTFGSMKRALNFKTLSHTEKGFRALDNPGMMGMGRSGYDGNEPVYESHGMNKGGRY